MLSSTQWVEADRQFGNLKFRIGSLERLRGLTSSRVLIRGVYKKATMGRSWLMREERRITEAEEVGKRKRND
jgi:hypothetical protein